MSNTIEYTRKGHTVTIETGVSIKRVTITKPNGDRSYHLAFSHAEARKIARAVINGK